MGARPGSSLSSAGMLASSSSAYNVDPNRGSYVAAPMASPDLNKEGGFELAQVSRSVIITCTVVVCNEMVEGSTLFCTMTCFYTPHSTRLRNMPLGRVAAVENMPWAPPVVEACGHERKNGSLLLWLPCSSSSPSRWPCPYRE